MTGDLFPEAHKPKAPEHVNRRYTTRAFMEWIKRKAGVSEWDLDAAADAESHWAPRWFCAPGDEVRSDLGCAGVDAFAHSWRPPPAWFEAVEAPFGVTTTLSVINDWGFSTPIHRVFLNSPFERLDEWMGLIWDQLAAPQPYVLPDFRYRIASVLPANRPEQDFWQKHIEPYRDGRVEERFGYRLETHYPPGRQAYGHPGCPEGSGSPEFASVVLVWRSA